MIVSHRHRFIFVKLPKTAGTSVEIALSSASGPDDILAPISPKDERLRLSRGPGAQNYQAPPLAVRAVNHAPARRIRRIVGANTWNEYTKFAVVRNPWDAVVSYFYWTTRLRDPGEITFDAFIHGGSAARLAEQHDLGLRIEGRAAMDRICRFERLREDLTAVWHDLGIPGEPDLPHTKQQARHGGSNYREHFTPETRAVVAELFKAQIEEYEYEF